jgi:cysteine desulfurase / selenocysteine lyase
MNIKNIKNDFPILKRRDHGKALVYLDNAATSQKPFVVMQAISEFYCQKNANVHRGVYNLAQEATEAYEGSRETVKKFFNSDVAVFTRNTTDAINMLAWSLGKTVKKGDEILVSELEHHSNLVPWQELARRTGAKLVAVPITKEGLLNEKIGESLISKKTKIVALIACSNALGVIPSTKEIIARAKEVGSTVVIDGAQLAPHQAINVKKMRCDFFVCSAHKMLGPMGIGTLLGQADAFETLEPSSFGGNMIREVSMEKATWNDIPWRFESGTQNVAGAIGFATALKYLSAISMEEIGDHEKMLIDYTYKKVQGLESIKLVGWPEKRKHLGIFSFTMEGIHPHDIAAILDTENVCVRAGHHCCMPLMKKLGLPGTTRASLYLYNDKNDIDALIAGLLKVEKVFHRG